MLETKCCKARSRLKFQKFVTTNNKLYVPHKFTETTYVEGVRWESLTYPDSSQLAVV